MMDMIGDREPKMLTLLRGSRDVNIDGDVYLYAAGPAEFFKWASVLSNPVTFAWRSTVTGERRLQVGGSSTQKPVHGGVTVLLDGDRYRDVWDAVVEDDLGCGEERPIDLDQFLHVARTPRERRAQSMPAA